MARLQDLPQPLREHLVALLCPSFENTPWVTGPPVFERRVAIVSTAGLHRRDDRPFEGMSGDFRIVPGDTSTADLVMSHVSTNFDRTGFQADPNVVFPLDRPRPWYDLHLERTGRTAAGVSGMDPEGVAGFLGAFLAGAPPGSPGDDLPAAVRLRLAAQDPRAFLFEAVAAQPGAGAPGSRAFADWFWGETAAGRVLRAVGKVCRGSADPDLRMVGQRLLVPVDRADGG